MDEEHIPRQSTCREARPCENGCKQPDGEWKGQRDLTMFNQACRVNASSTYKPTLLALTPIAAGML